TFNPNAAHPKYSLDDQKTQVPSQTGSWTGGFMQNGADFGSTDLIPLTITGDAPDNTATGATDPLSGQDLFRVSIDGSNYVNVSLPISAGETTTLNGSGLANAISLALNDQLGDERFFDFSSATDKSFRVTTVDDNLTESSYVITIDPADVGKTDTTMLPADIVAAVRAQLAQTPVDPNDPAGETLGDRLSVSYNIRERAIQFKPASSANDKDVSQIRITGWDTTLNGGTGGAAENLILGFGATSETIAVGASVTLGAYLSDALVPNGDFRLDPDQQRSGIDVEYLRDERRFVFYSGTTGEASTIEIEPLYRFLDANGDPTGDVVPLEQVEAAIAAGTAALANVRAGQVLGFAEEVADEILVRSGTGLPGIPAITTGSRTGVDTSGTFPVTFQDNVISVTV
ncbi:MAG: hypothetical protein EBR20_11155, partial [Bacteroidetes bacterium]|nr:hypothetical protein [Bacteroidota bacterium]